MYYILRIIYYEPCAMYYVPWTKLPTTFGKLTRFMFSCLFQEAGHIGADGLLHSENDQVRSLKTLVRCHCGSRSCRKKDETNRTTAIELLSKRTITVSDDSPCIFKQGSAWTQNETTKIHQEIFKRDGQDTMVIYVHRVNLERFSDWHSQLRILHSYTASDRYVQRSLTILRRWKPSTWFWAYDSRWSDYRYENICDAMCHSYCDHRAAHHL